MFKFTNQKDTPELISVKLLLLSIGILAFALPLILVLVGAGIGECELIQNSISAYYHTIGRNVFVGTLCAISFCLFAYMGYSDLDNILANLAAVLALCVAFFPTSVSKIMDINCIEQVVENGIIGKIHFVAAAALFILLGCFSAFIFTKSSGGETTRGKVIRNRVFKICGYSIFAFIILIACYFQLESRLPQDIIDFRPVFWLESLSLWAFAFSWLTKSGIIYKD